jgi:hypothetical protein
MIVESNEKNRKKHESTLFYKFTQQRLSFQQTKKEQEKTKKHRLQISSVQLLIGGVAG